MASGSSGVQHYQTNPYHCKECGLYLNSAESLEVHLQYHKENLLNKWATQATPHEETNNNNTKPSVKREFIQNTIAAADSSDAMIKKSPEYGSRTTPETTVSFGHPPTPQSYHSASSPYQSTENNAFSPGYQSYVKTERLSPHFQQQSFQNFNENQFFVDNQTQYTHEYHKMQNSPYRYHPYQSFDRTQVSSSSPAYPPQPTPSPSPKQCDKCGFLCESAAQLVEHQSISHPPTPAPHLQAYQQQNMFFANQQEQIKREEDAQSEILDLDSHKVHQVYPEEEKRQNGENPHSVSGLLSWPPQKMYQYQEQKMFQNGDNKMFQAHPEFLASTVTTTTQENLITPQNYRAFDQLPPANAPVITSTQITNSPAPTVPPSTKSANWKSNEARRPKTYNCTACNKWFTSSGHLKRHYNTTLHKNAVKSSGQPDPATLPISAHHHPAREATTSRGDDQSGSPSEDSRGDDSMPPQFDRTPTLPGLLQQPPNGPYDRQQQHPLSNGSPPNGEAGPSTTRGGLLSHGFSMAAPLMEGGQFQMYPNASAPHVTQVTATSSPSIIGEYQLMTTTTDPQQPLPSFAQFQAHRYGILLGYGGANVGGGGPATAPYTYYTENNLEMAEPTSLIFRQEEENYRLTVLTSMDQAAVPEEEILGYSSPNNNNNDVTDLQQISETEIVEDIKVKFEPQPLSPEKAKTKRDYEETTGSPLISSTVQAKQAGIHKCFDCDKIFNKACYLTQHNKTFHSGDKPFKCSRCGKRFSCENQYEDHLKKHAGDKPYKCDLCPKQFNHKTDLRRHMCLHTGQKPYACETCGKGFIRKDHMLKHCETHTKKPHAVKVAAVR